MAMNPRILLCCAAWLLSILPLTVPAQTYPTQPIKLVVDAPPGNPSDVWARRYAVRMGDFLRQPVVVENKPGASGSIAAEMVLNSRSDGYTVLYGGISSLITFPAAGGVTRYDAVKDFLPIALGTMGYPIVVVNTKSGIKTLAQFIDAAKAKPDEFVCGSAGHASIQHFACAEFSRAVGIKTRVLPYKGSSAALLDLAGGQIHFSVGYPSELEPFISSGRLMGIASLSPARQPRFPDAPTLAEAGFGRVEFPTFAGFFVPATTPADVVEKISSASIKAMQQPEMAEWMVSLGGIYQPYKPEEFSRFVRAEQRRWREIAQNNNIKLE